VSGGRKRGFHGQGLGRRTIGIIIIIIIIIIKEVRIQLDKKHWYEHVPKSVETTQGER
jgi:hypothetical protein